MTIIKTVLLVSVLSVALLMLVSCSSEPHISYESLTCEDLSERWVGYKWKDNFKRNNEILAIEVSQRLERTKGDLKGIGCDSVATLKYGLAKRELLDHKAEIVLQAWKQSDGAVKHEFAFCYIWDCEQVFNDR